MQQVGEIIPPEIADMILAAGYTLLSSFGETTKSLTELSVSPEVVGKDVSEVLIQWRAEIVHLLLVFRDYILPSSQSNINDVEKTLRTYFGPRSTFDQFKTLLPNLRARLNPRIKGARDAQTKITLMSADLIQLSKTFDAEIGSVGLLLKEALTANSKDATKAKEAAERMKTVGTASRISALVGKV